MHDPTEGGIRAGWHEIAFASRVRLDVDLDRIPAPPPTAAICRHYGIDQRGGLATTRRALAVDNSGFLLSKPLASRLPRSGSMIIDGDGCASGDDRLRLAVALAHQGGRQAVAARGTARVGWKAPGDRVTDVDVAIQVRLVDRIRTCFPGDGIVAEEGAAADPGEREFVWAIDPLHLAYAAIGALDVVQDHKATLWDVAAGAAILLEAGGTITESSRPAALPSRRRGVSGRADAVAGW
jgi:Inositol monophosphatase family